MTATATLVGENLDNYCPITNHYQCSDGKYLLVTVKNFDHVPDFGIPISRSHAPQGTDVFLADEQGMVVDADGDPATGMTALAQFDAGTSFEDALAQLGYQLQPGEE